METSDGRLLKVHERDLFTEFLLLAVRQRLLQGRMKLRLVLMSATLSSDLFLEFLRPVRSSFQPPTPTPF